MRSRQFNILNYRFITEVTNIKRAGHGHLHFLTISAARFDLCMMSTKINTPSRINSFVLVPGHARIIRVRSNKHSQITRITVYNIPRDRDVGIRGRRDPEVGICLWCLCHFFAPVWTYPASRSFCVVYPRELFNTARFVQISRYCV